MRYEDRLIDEVQAANDIVEIIQQYIPLKRSGRNFKAVCPFHQEKTPSFMVHPEKQIFHCFGCSAGGNVFTFLMRHENASFPEVLRQLAERAHIQLPEASVQKHRDNRESEQLYEVYRLATVYYQKQYQHPERGAVARDYVQSRQFSPEIQEEFQFGWAAAGWTHLFDALSRKGFSNDLLLKSGLAHRSPKGHFYDTFRGRLLIPIRNLQGKTVAFGGRVIGQNEGPKYLNSPENPIFYKRRELFGLDKAKRFIDRDYPKLILVEGYFDFLRLYQCGIRNAVATLGTALTEDHVRVLKRFVDEAIVVYDGDRAGEAASMRGLEVFLEGGMNVKLVRMPEGFDPDDYLQKKGPDAFHKEIGEARDFFDFKLESLLRRYKRSDSLGLMKMTNEFLETFMKVQNPILLSHYLRRLAASLGIDENSLRSEMSKMKEKGKRNQAPAGIALPALEPKGLTDENLLLALALDDSDTASELCRELVEDDFHEGWTRALFSLMKNRSPSEKPLSWAQVLSRLKDETARSRLIAASHIEWSNESRAKALNDCLKRIRDKRVEDRLKELRFQISRAEKEGNQELLGRYVKEYQSLMKHS